VTETPRVERATPADAAALAALAAESLPEPWSEAGFAAELAAPAARCWLLRGPAGVPLGYLAAHRVLDELQIHSLAVAPGERRRGLGRALVEHALAAEPGVRVAHLEVRCNDASAQAFYAALGFGPVGRRAGFYPGGIDAVSMSRAIHAAPPAPPRVTPCVELVKPE
jgi:ribosomal protein S18 acetylase RimI-like enzyme